LFRLLAFALIVLTGGWIAAGAPSFARAADMPTRFVGPTRILFVDADSVYLLRSLEWNSDYVREQEKLLLHSLRMSYWRDHLPADMRAVFEALGYPVSRVRYTPVGHTEEWWSYRLLDPPLRFRDGVLIDTDRFEALRSR
jgi:hypothetical protein